MEYPNKAPENPLVSVCIQTYNHAPYIAQCIEGALMQETDFPYEIIIGEDESTDGTREICIEYAKKYPEKIRLFLRNRKDVVFINGKPTGQFNYQSNLKAAKGKFIAICEGDDYWDDRSKLKTQVAFLESNQDLTGCFHDARTIDAKGHTIKERYYTPKKHSYDQLACLLELGSSYASCTLMYKRMVLDEPWPSWFQQRTCDETVDLLITEYGLLGFFPENMAAYRIHIGGIWQGNSDANNKKELFHRGQILLRDKKMRKRYKKYLKTRLRNIAEKLAFQNVKGASSADKIKFALYFLLNSSPFAKSSFIIPIRYLMRKIITKTSFLS